MNSTSLPLRRPRSLRTLTDRLTGFVRGRLWLQVLVATLFLAQVFQVDVGLSQLILVVLLAVGASIGSPGTPGIGIVILSMLLVSVGIPAEGIALIIGVDRLLDMCRTTLNVTGDLVAASIMDRWLPPSTETS